MRAPLLKLFFMTTALLLLVTPAFSSDQTTEKEVLPKLMLPAPANEVTQVYLGINKPPGEQFDVRDIKADLLLIELFSMYCPFCQEEAPNVNLLYEIMADFSTDDFSVKMIGLGANNSDFEVEHFRTTYDVRFPLFPDQDMSMYKALDGKGTPGFIACKMEEDGSCTIIHRQSGGFYHAEEFFKELLTKSGYNH